MIKKLRENSLRSPRLKDITDTKKLSEDALYTKLAAPYIICPPRLVVSKMPKLQDW
jgi:hypothetical protein